MKKTFLPIIILLCFFCSCKKETKVTPVILEKTATEALVSKECYMGILKKDTFSMTLILKENQQFTGELNYKFYEKDSNKGTLAGQIKGDTLIADYIFMSEGISSIRQVVFLKKANALIEGYGDVIDDNKGKVLFKDMKKLNFEGKTILSKVDCK